MSDADFAFPKRWLRLIVLVAVGLVAAGLTVPGVQARGRTQAPAATALDVQPFPGTPDASPQTEISFPSLSVGQIRSVSVSGSRSGSHQGEVIALPGTRGSAFVPRRPFAAGERVSVHATLASPSAGSDAGAPGATRISFSFQIEVPASLGSLANNQPSAYSGSNQASAHAAQDTNGLTHTFYSDSSIHPPIITVSGHDPDPSQGDIFADAENSVQAGPLILDPYGQLVYFQPTVHSAAFNLEVQNYQGQSVLTYFQGYVPNRLGYGIGRDVILDHQYQPVAYVNAGNGYSADLHEFQITPQGDAFITAYTPIKADLRTVGGPRDGTMLDSMIQEINIASGKVLWEWHAYGHIHLIESYQSYARETSSGQIYDPFHINSLQLLPNGNLLISARHTWALYEINMKTGKIPLNIGGKHSSFRMTAGTNFEWQHAAHRWPDGTITVFDNASNGGTSNERQSRALQLFVHYKDHYVNLIRAYTNNPSQLSSSQGSVEPLADRNVFVGWGAAPYMSEFTPSGSQLFSFHFNGGIQSYRALRFQWWGQPTTPPGVAVRRSSQGTFVFASWNGATTVASWRVFSGPSPNSLTSLGQFSKTHFETTIWVRNTEPYFEVQALDSSGNVLGTSSVVER